MDEIKKSLEELYLELDDLLKYSSDGEWGESTVEDIAIVRTEIKDILDEGFEPSIFFRKNYNRHYRR